MPLLSELGQRKFWSPSGLAKTMWARPGAVTNEIIETLLVGSALPPPTIRGVEASPLGSENDK